MNHRILILLILIASAITLASVRPPSEKQLRAGGSGADTSWEVQLNEMNHLVVKASSVNLIRGLHLSREQASQLKVHAASVAALLPPCPDSRGRCLRVFSLAREIYMALIDRLIRNDTLGNAFEQQVLEVRKQEAEVIRLSVIAAEQRHYQDRGCIKCHALPEHFPSGGTMKKEAPVVTASMRRETDLAHIEGLLGKEATQKLWDIKDDVYQILTRGQQCLTSGFRCCLLSPDGLKNPERIGQAASTDAWTAYLDAAYPLSDEDWKIYRSLYLDPVAEIIEASLPGIRKKEVERRTAKVEEIISLARGLSRMDYEIQREALAEALINAISVDALNGEEHRNEDERRFLAAMFLLYHGSENLYDQIIRSYD